MDKIAQDFGNLIKEHRKAKGFTQAEVAKKLGISQVSYGRYELGLREPSLQMIIDISSLLGFEPGDFFNSYLGR